MIDEKALKRWKINLPVFPFGEVGDNSITDTYGRCPRLGLYRYGLNRGFGGRNASISFGLAYHKYREVVENLMREEKVKMNDYVHRSGMDAAMKGWEDPPIGHKKVWLNRGRLSISCDRARLRIIQEQLTGSIEITRAEDSFDLELPFMICSVCGWGILANELDNHLEDDGPFCCTRCGAEEKHIFRARHGGRVDQFVKANKAANRIRDFKTTAFKGPKYEEKFSPNSQMQGYVWAGSQLSGRNFDGALIETIHNTKSVVAKISQHYVTFSKGQQEQWVASRMMEHSMIHMMWSRYEELGYLAFPQRTSECSNFAGCAFREACKCSSGKELENWLKNYTVESVWDFTNPDKEVSKVK